MCIAKLLSPALWYTGFSRASLAVPYLCIDFASINADPECL